MTFGSLWSSNLFNLFPPPAPPFDSFDGRKSEHIRIYVCQPDVNTGLHAVLQPTLVERDLSELSGSTRYSAHVHQLLKPNYQPSTNNFVKRNAEHFRFNRNVIVFAYNLLKLDAELEIDTRSLLPPPPEHLHKIYAHLKSRNINDVHIISKNRIHAAQPDVLSPNNAFWYALFFLTLQN